MKHEVEMLATICIIVNARLILSYRCEKIIVFWFCTIKYHLGWARVTLRVLNETFITKRTALISELWFSFTMRFNLICFR